MKRLLKFANARSARSRAACRVRDEASANSLDCLSSSVKSERPGGGQRALRIAWRGDDEFRAGMAPDERQCAAQLFGERVDDSHAQSLLLAGLEVRRQTD